MPDTRMIQTTVYLTQAQVDYMIEYDINQSLFIREAVSVRIHDRINKEIYQLNEGKKELK